MSKPPYQKPNYLCKTHDSVKQEFGENPITSQLLNWDLKVGMWGSPIEKGFEGKNIVRVPIEGFGPEKTDVWHIRCHQKLAPLFQSVFRQIKKTQSDYTLRAGEDTSGYLFRYSILSHYKKALAGTNNYPDVAVWAAPWANLDLNTEHEMESGVLVERQKGVYQTCPKHDLLSNHAFGSAIDLNSGTNPYNHLQRFDIRKSIIEIFHEHGFSWGGYYDAPHLKRHDYMHFEYLQDKIKEKLPPLKVFPVLLKEDLHVNRFSVDQYFDHTEKENDNGFFPVGLNALWHGGIHLSTKENTEVFACMDGEVILGRLGSKDKCMAANGSTNFMVIKHDVAGKTFYSLYQHLAPNAFEESDSNLQTYQWLMKQEELETFKVKAKDGLPVRPEPKGKTSITTLPTGTEFKVSEETKHAPWRELVGEYAGNYVNCDLQYAEKQSPKVLDNELFQKLKNNELAAINRKVEAGDLLWSSGTYGKESSLRGQLHFEIFSQECLTPEDNSSSPQSDPPPPAGSGVWQNGSRFGVKAAAGPGAVAAGTEAVFYVTKIKHKNPPESELNKISWELKRNGVLIERFKNHGPVLKYQIPFGEQGNVFKAYPYRAFTEPHIVGIADVGSTWGRAEDSVINDFNIENEKVLQLFGEQVLEDGTIDLSELADFYKNNPNGQAAKARTYACKFTNEWAIPDLDAAIQKLKGKYKVDKDLIEPFQWWQLAKTQKLDAKLPTEVTLWHYNPIAFFTSFEGN